MVLTRALSAFFAISILCGAALGGLPVVSLRGAVAGKIEVHVKRAEGSSAQAKVWVETVDGGLLAEGQTDEAGVFSAEISPENLSSGVDVTAWAKGFGAVTGLQVKTGRVDLTLPAIEIDDYAILKGTMRGFSESGDSKRAVLGLVGKTFEVSDLFKFELNQFISPLSDNIQVFGTRPVPSNFVFPKQTFFVYMVPITIDKSQFRLPLAAGGVKRVFGLAGSVEALPAVDALRDGRVLEALNFVNFNKLVLSDEIGALMSRQTLSIDLALNTRLSKTQTIEPGRNLSMFPKVNRMLLALNERLPGVFVPTDLRLVNRDRVAVSTLDRERTGMMDLFVTEDGMHFKGAWLESGVSRLPDTGISADLTMNGLEGGWAISGAAGTQMMTVHLESKKRTSVGGFHAHDQWILQGPRRSLFRLPARARNEVLSELGKINQVTVDLMQMASGGYPVGREDISAREILAVEKVTKAVP